MNFRTDQFHIDKCAISVFQIMKANVFLSYTQFGEFYPTHRGIENRSADKYRGEHTGCNTDTESDGKPLDRPRPELKQHHRGDQGSDIGIDYGTERLGEPGIDSRPNRFPDPNFLPDAFKDQNVRVDGHPHSQEDSRDPR